jgi:hypothetical protein
MSKRNWKILFEDIIESITKIKEYTKDLSFEDFVQTPLVIDAVVRNIEIIGEASKNIPQEIQNKFKDIPWKKISSIPCRINSNIYYPPFVYLLRYYYYLLGEKIEIKSNNKCSYILFILCSFIRLQQEYENRNNWEVERPEWNFYHILRGWNCEGSGTERKAGIC